MKKNIDITIYTVFNLRLELNEDLMYEVFTTDGTPLGAFDPYLSEHWDYDDTFIIAGIVEDLIETDHLYLPYVDNIYYAAA